MILHRFLRPKNLRFYATEQPMTKLVAMPKSQRPRCMGILRAVIILVTLQFCTSLYSQSVVNEVAQLDINFGSGSYIRKVFTDGKLLFTLAMGRRGISVGIFDMTNPDSLVELGRQEGSTFQGNSEFSNRVIYLENMGLTSPAYAVMSASGEDVLHYFWYPGRVVIHEGLLYEFRNYRPEVRIFRVESPTEFSLMKTDTLNFNLSGISGLALVDDVIYITTRHAGDYPCLMVLDISEPGFLVELERPITGKDLTGIVLGDSIALVGHDFRNMIVLDILDPRQPTVLYSGPFSHALFHGLWENDRFYLKGSHGIVILTRDLEKKADIETTGYVASIAVNNTDLVTSTNLGLETYDLSDESHPIQQSTYGANIALPVKFDKEGDLLYIADLGDGLKIVDVTNKDLPSLIGENDFNGYAVDVTVSGDFALVADYLKGLIIVDIRKPKSPEVVSTFSIEGGAVAVSVREGKAFVINDQNELFVIDVSDVHQPRITLQERLDTPRGIYYGRYKSLVEARGLIWMKLSGHPLHAYWYSAENGLTEVFRDENHSYPFEIKATDDHLFVVTWNGIQIMDLDSLSFIKEEPFGVDHMEENPVAVAIDDQNDVLYVSLGVFGISGIEAYDISVPENPRRLEGYSGLGFAPREMIFEQELLYALIPDGVGIYSPGNAVGVKQGSTPNLPVDYVLNQNYPNPFNPSTTIEFSVPQAGMVTLTIYDLLGREVKTILSTQMDAGHHKVQWDASNVPSGIYFVRMQAEGPSLRLGQDFTQTRKVTVLR